MIYDFLNIRATYTTPPEGKSFGYVTMENLEQGEPVSVVARIDVANFNNTENELRELILSIQYPLPAVQPPEGSPERVFGGQTVYTSARKEAYPEIGDQLDMIYKDMVAGGTSFVDAISNIKNSIPKPEVIERPPEGMSEAYKQTRLDAWNAMYGFNLSLQEYYG